MKTLRLLTVLLVGSAILLSLTPRLFAAESAKGTANDSTITTEIKGKLAKDVRLGTLTGIEVNTTKGVVTLAGKVHNKDEKKQVEKVAKSIKGVTKVKNNLEIVP